MKDLLARCEKYMRPPAARFYTSVAKWREDRETYDKLAAEVREALR